VETPALIVDLEAFERNCDTLRSIMKSEFAGVRCRYSREALRIRHVYDFVIFFCERSLAFFKFFKPYLGKETGPLP